jgi:hypothetical protein
MLELIGIKDRMQKLTQSITLTSHNGLEGRDSLLDVDKRTLDTSENLRHSEGLAEETLDLSCTLDSELIGLGQFIHALNKN